MNSTNVSSGLGFDEEEDFEPASGGIRDERGRMQHTRSDGVEEKVQAVAGGLLSPSSQPILRKERKPKKQATTSPLGSPRGDEGPFEKRKNGGIYAGGTKAFPKDEVKRCMGIFRLYDVDGTGGVDEDEFEVLFTVLRYPKEFTREEVVAYFLKFDMDEDGVLDEDEFLRCIIRELSRKTAARRRELYGLLERGIDGGRRLMGIESEEEEGEGEVQGEPEEELTEEEQKAIAAPEHERIRKAKTMDELQIIRATIEEHVLFEKLPGDRLNEICHNMAEVEIAAGDRLIRQGRKNDTMFIVNRGEFKLFKDVYDEKGMQPFGRIDCEQGSIFGAVGLVSDNLATREVVAHEPAVLWSINKKEFEKGCGMPWESRMYLSLKDNLRNTTWFPEVTDFTERAIQWLCEQMTPLIVEPGDTVIWEGDDSDRSLYFIREGECFVKGGELGDERVVRLEEGSIFGETALLFQTDRTANVVAGKECKKCIGIGEVGPRFKKFPCARCGASGARTDGDLVVLYRLSQEAYAQFLQMPDLKGNANAAGLYMMRYVLRRCVKTAYPKVPWRQAELARLADAFEFHEYDAGDMCANQGDVWDNFSIVVKGMVKCFQNDRHFKDCIVTNLVSDFENLRAPFTISCPDATHIACLSRQKVRELVPEDIAVGLVGSAVTKARHFEFRTISPMFDGHWGRVDFVERLKDKRKFVCHKIVKQRVEDHWGFDIKAQAEDVVSGRREVLELIDSSCVARLQSVGLCKKNLYMWVEFCPGGSLSLLLENKGKISQKAAMFYFGCALTAVQEMQRKKIVHRDLCPNNLLIAGDGYLKIIGFGRAKKLHRPETRTICGTPYYMSPEMLQGRGHGLAHDVWQLGVLLYHMVVGRSPFEATLLDATLPQIYIHARDMENPAFNALSLRIINGSVAYPWDIGVKVHNLVRGMLDPFPDRRQGCGHRGLREVRKHLWFKEAELDWEALEEKRVKPPFIPPSFGDEDLRHYPHRPGKEAKETVGRTSDWVPTMW